MKMVVALIAKVVAVITGAMVFVEVRSGPLIYIMDSVAVALPLQSRLTTGGCQ